MGQVMKIFLVAYHAGKAFETGAAGRAEQLQDHREDGGARARE